MIKLSNIPHVIPTSHSHEFEGRPFILTASECDHCKTLILESKILGIYTFVTNGHEAKDFFEEETLPTFLTQNYLVLENGYAVEEKITLGRNIHYGILEVNVDGSSNDSPESLLKKINGHYQPLQTILDVHTLGVEQMKRTITPVDSLYQSVHLLPTDPYAWGDREGILIKKGEVKNTSGLSDNSYTITSSEKRYVYFKNKFTATLIYYLKETDSVAIKSPSFFKSDVYLLTPDEFKTNVI